jgi:hypothetical protein
LHLVFDGPDFQLAWPRDLFMSEATALLAAGQETDASRVKTLLEEAFVSSAPVEAFQAAPAHSETADDLTADPWGVGVDRQPPSPRWQRTPAPISSLTRIGQADFLRALVECGDSLAEFSVPRAYWPHRHGRAPESAIPGVTVEQAKRQFGQLVEELTRLGYLDNVFPRPCVDDYNAVEPDQSAVLYDRLGLPDLWPLRPGEWNDDVFFGLVEVFHDLVARPRYRSWHSWNQCGYHFDSYASSPARRLYIWRVNIILSRTDLPLRMADDGEDSGLVVQIVPDDRHLLVQRAIQTPDPRARGHVQHAIALFRKRAATEQDRRSAVVSLAHVLESRRSLRC